MDAAKMAKLLNPPPAAPAMTPKKDYIFDLKLFESNDETYPEFSWKELVKEADRKELLAQKAAAGKTTLDPYVSGDEDDLQAMAARFEAKYNNGPSTKRKRRAEDYIDRGAGYDDNDSFIDNSEIYDEVVPEDLQPVHGGFYINSGSLDFKEAEVSDCDIDEELEERKAKSGKANDPTKSTDGRKPPPAPKKITGLSKRRVSNTVDAGIVTVKPAKIISRKNSASPRGDTSRSSSPNRQNSKARTITISSSLSDSSTSGSSDSSSSDSSSDSENDKGKIKQEEHVETKVKDIILPTATVAKVPATVPLPINTVAKVPAIAPTNISANPPPQRRLKVKNVPLNPKLHGNGPTVPIATSNPTTQNIVAKIKTPMSSPMSNRDIFGPPKSNLSTLNIPSGLSATSIHPANLASTVTTTLPSTLQQSPTVGTNLSKKNVNRKPTGGNGKKRVTPATVDTSRNSISEAQKMSMLNTSSLGISPSIQSPVRKKAKIDGKVLPNLPTTVQGLKPKKPRKPRVGSVIRDSGGKVKSQTTQQQHLNHQQQVQAFQQLQLQATLNQLGLSHLLASPRLPSSPLQSSPSAFQSNNSTGNQKPGNNSSKGMAEAAAAALKNLAAFQSQIGSNVTVTEVKNKNKTTKSHAPSPTTSMATISPRSSTPPGYSRINTPSPINLPRLPIPSSITVTSTGLSLPNPSTKTFTPFDVNALLSKQK